MIDFIPLQHYYTIYIHFCFFFILANLIHAYQLDIDEPKNILFLKVSGIILFFFTVFYLGLRPISGYVFGDMGTYSRYFKKYSMGEPVTVIKDYLFHHYMKLTSYFTSVHGFFLITEFLYVFPMYFISKKYFKDYWFYSFLMLLVAFSFYTYGVNGIRNGVATSFFLWAICYTDQKVIMYSLFIIATMFHKTLMLPVLAFILTYFYNNPQSYLKAWLLSIPMSLVLGGVWVVLFTSLGFGDERLAGYLSGESSSEVPESKGFRWDFIFYSSFPVFAGWYFIVKKKFEDSFYNQIYATYLICNSFWILVIRASFSNRFAYLSWFLMSLVIIYPFLKQKFFQNQELVIAKVIVAYFLFTYLMWLIYYA